MATGQITNSLIVGLTAQMVQARVNTADASKFYFGTHFPVKRVNGFSWRMLENQLEGKNVAADIHTDNGTIVRKRRPIFDVAQGDIPYIAVSREMTRKDLKDYQTALALANDADHQNWWNIGVEMLISASMPCSRKLKKSLFKHFRTLAYSRRTEKTPHRSRLIWIIWLTMIKRSLPQVTGHKKRQTSSPTS